MIQWTFSGSNGRSPGGAATKCNRRAAPGPRGGRCDGSIWRSVESIGQAGDVCNVAKAPSPMGEGLSRLGNDPVDHFRRKRAKPRPGRCPASRAGALLCRASIAETYLRFVLDKRCSLATAICQLRQEDFVSWLPSSDCFVYNYHKLIDRKFCIALVT